MISSPLSTHSAGSQPEARTPSRANDQPWVVLAGLTILYAFIVSLANRRFVWFDELFTFDIANAPTLRDMWKIIRSIDFQPPTGFLLSRFSMKLLGQTPFALRLPSMLEFYVASMALFFYVRRKVGAGYAAAGVLILWVGGSFTYATEARPYALLLMFFALLLLSWDVAITSEKRGFALCCVAVSNLGMLWAHVFAPLSLLPFIAAEATRFRHTHKTDFALWAALLLPMATVAVYLPLFQGYRSLTFPVAFQASLGRIPRYYYDSINLIADALFVALCAALMVSPEKPQRRSAPIGHAEDLVLFAFLLLNPVFLNLALMRRHGAFWDRYAITTQATIYVGLVLLLGIRLGRSRSAGYTAAAVLLLFCLWYKLGHRLPRSYQTNAAVLAPVRPDLPLVAASGVTFFEMNHHDQRNLLSRLYFLKDRAIALRYTNTNLFEDRGFPNHINPNFPISAHVASYTDFIQEHREFLVLGTYAQPEEWLLRKLKDDGAQLTWLGTYAVPYVDQDLYLVKLRADN